MQQKPSWDNFYKDFTTNNYIYDLTYKNNVYTIGSEKKQFNTKTIWFLATQHSKDSKPFCKIFNSPQDLLDNATIENKTLKSIWDDIIIN